MTEAQRKAYGDIATAGDLINKTIVHARSTMQPLTLRDEIMAKLIEAQEATFAAHRLMETL